MDSQPSQDTTESTLHAPLSTETSRARRMSDSLLQSQVAGQTSRHSNTCEPLLFMEVALESAFNAGVREPARAIAQLLTGKDLIETSDANSRPETQIPGSTGWYGETIGAGLGMVLPFKVTQTASSKLLNAIGKSAAAAERAMLGSNATKVLLRAAESNQIPKALLPISKGLFDGAVFGYTMMPSQNLDEGGSERLIHAATGAVVLGAQGATTLLSFGAYRKCGTPIGDRTFLRSTDGLALRLVTGCWSGAAAGTAFAHGDSLLNGRGLADQEAVSRSILTFAIAGTTLNLLQGVPSPQLREPPAGRFPRDVTSHNFFSRDALGESAAIRRFRESHSTNPISIDRGEGLARFEQEQPSDSRPRVNTTAASNFQRLESMGTQPHMFFRSKNSGPADLTSLDAFHDSAVAFEAVNSRIYRVDGHATTIIVPEQYACQLDIVRSARASGQPLPAQYQDLRFRVLPEDLVPLIDRLPDGSLINRLCLTNEANPLDPWYAHNEGDPWFKSAASANGHDEVVFYQKDLDPFTGLELKHEWSHLLRWHRPRESFLFNLASKVEPETPPMRMRGLTNNNELWAVLLGEHLLDGKADGGIPCVPMTKLEAFTANAPIKALVLSEAVLNHAIDQGNALPENIRSDINDAVALAKPKAVDALVKLVNESKEPNVRSTAAQLLLHLGEANRLAASQPIPLNLSADTFAHAVATDLTRVPLGELNLSYTPTTSLKFLKADHPALTKLDLSGTQLRPSELSVLSRLKSLTELSLANSRVGDGAVPYLSTLSKLTILDLRNTNISQSATSSLRARLIACNILGP